MATTGQMPPRQAPSQSRWSAEPESATPSDVVARHNWPRLALGVIVVLASGLFFTSLYRSAGDRRPVLALARDVGRYQPVERGDLRTVLVGAEPGVELVPEADLDDVVGRVAVTELPAGSLLSPAQLSGKDDPIVGPTEAVVGAKLGAGSAPVGELPAGTPVLVVIRPGGSSTDAGVRQIHGWVAELGERSPNGTREASLVVPEQSAGTVAAAAAEERIAVVSLEGG